MNILEQIKWIKENKKRISNSDELLSILEKLHQQESRFTKDELLNLARRIKPIVRVNKDGLVGIDSEAQKFDLFWIETCPIKSHSFVWKVKPLAKVSGLKEIARITSYHTYGGYYGFLRPSTDEAIYQCPENILDRICAFEVFSSNDSIYDIFHAGLDRHVLTTIYYEGQLPADIADQDVSW